MLHKKFEIEIKKIKPKVETNVAVKNFPGKLKKNGSRSTFKFQLSS